MLSNLILIFSVLIGGFLRFYKLDWGEGFFFHPDEYHIVGAVNRLNFPTQMDPDLFSYGSLIVYQIYFTRLILQAIRFQFLNLSPFLIGRFYSALYSTLTIPVIFLISERVFKNRRTSLIAVLLTASLPGLIQQAHFATPEAILTFWLFLALLMIIHWLEDKRLSRLYLAAIFLGLAMGTKITALIFLPVLLFSPLVALKIKLPRKWQPKILLKKLAYFITALVKFWLLPLLITFLTFALAFPYALIRWKNFLGTTTYESGIGRGTTIVFYTRQFINTIPILFQFEKILPYALGPSLLVLGLLGLAIFAKNSLKDKKLFFILLAFASWFLPNAIFFAKWTRFLSPSFPYFALFAAYLLGKLKRPSFKLACYLLVVINLVWSLMFFTIYLRPDTRITATDWINQNLSSQSHILVESGNMSDIPLWGNIQRTSFDFYHFEENSKLREQLPEKLVQVDYFIIQSRRIFINHQRLPEKFPKTTRFYDSLFSGELGFEKIKEINSFPQFCFFQIPDELAEETWSVFDHPVIRFYKKTTPLNKHQYESLLLK